MTACVGIDMAAFWRDPPPMLARLRKEAPISAYRPSAELGAIRENAILCFPEWALS
jgi:hypothetical protein